MSNFNLDEVKYKLKELVLYFLTLYRLIKGFLRAFFLKKLNLLQNKKPPNLSVSYELV